MAPLRVLYGAPLWVVKFSKIKLAFLIGSFFKGAVVFGGTLF